MKKLQGSDPESLRLREDDARTANWKRFGPYLAERQWGTVREDYSPDGACWGYFSHDHARSRAYRWGEDGLLGLTDRECRLAFSVALWNGEDPILKERLFGLTGPEGNHGEDVKEAYWYVDSTPTHSYMEATYRYPQRRYPYEDLVTENARRGKLDREYELEDTGVFSENRFFDVTAAYAKASPDDVLIRITVTNRGPEARTVHLLPTLWFRYLTLRYRFDDEGVSMRVGLLFKKEILLTYRRIQDIHLTRNIIQRWLGLATVSVQTASGNAGPEMTIEGILEAEQLRDFLYQKMRGARGETTDVRTAQLTANHSTATALLTEIRDNLVKLNSQQQYQRASLPEYKS